MMSARVVEIFFFKSNKKRKIKITRFLNFNKWEQIHKLNKLKNKHYVGLWYCF